jgi:hypothetical protein
LVNSDVPQDIIRRLLDHTSLQMTSLYAQLSDRTVRDSWERARKVDVRGDPVVFDPASPLADAMWMKEHLGRAQMALPNGYCGLPLQQTCPHANACLTCPLFVTTAEFLPEHRKQLATTERLIAQAEDRGQERMADMNRSVATNLIAIIGSLEADQGDDECCTRSGACRCAVASDAAVDVYDGQVDGTVDAC